MKKHKFFTVTIKNKSKYSKKWTKYIEDVLNKPETINQFIKDHQRMSIELALYGRIISKDLLRYFK